MKIIRQSWEFLMMTVPDGDGILRLIEQAGRTCYKSEDKITPDSAKAFVKRMLASGHHSVIEHPSIAVRIITDRGVTHEIVRHRLASYSQESTRYCNYGISNRGMAVILPVWMYECGIQEGEYSTTDDRKLRKIMNQAGTGYRYWITAMFEAEALYNTLLQHEWTPQQARSVLPNSLKTEIVMTCNIREWRHFFNLRCSPAAHPQMRELALSMLKGFKAEIPVLFDDLYPEEGTQHE